MPRGLLCTLSLLMLGVTASHALSLNEAIQKAWLSAPLFQQQLEADQHLYGITKTESWQHLLPNEPQFFYGNTDDNTSEVYGVTETMAFPGKALAYAKQALAFPTKNCKIPDRAAAQ